jgi:hypothetical protein
MLAYRSKEGSRTIAESSDVDQQDTRIGFTRWQSGSDISLVEQSL